MTPNVAKCLLVSKVLVADGIMTDEERAFLDDVMGLAIGPLFVCAEAFFFFGARPAVRRYVEERVGPTVARREHPPSGEPATR